MTVAWVRANWPAPEGVTAGTTCRGTGVSRGRYRSLNLGAHVDDDPQAVRENRRRFREHFELPSEPLWLDQVHGAGVLIEPRQDDHRQADAIVCRRRGAVCSVLTADCVPVLLTAADGSEVAAAHAGWRGLLAGVIDATVRAMHSGPEQLLAWLGPAISQPAFEVGDEVREQFLRGDPRADRCFAANENGRWQADLVGLVRRRLERVGVDRVYGGEHCTYTERDAFFSYRRDGQCGRMASFVFREDA